MKCRLCQSEKTFYVFKKNTIIWGIKEGKEVWTIYECSDCKCRFIDNNQNKFDISLYYNEGYSENKVKDLEKSKIKSYKRRGKIQSKIINNILNNKQEKYKILDIGCNTGNFLSCLSHKFDKYGVELSAAAAKRASEKNIKVFNNKIEGVKFEPESFDVVTLFALIEHLEDPLTILKKMEY